MTTAVLMHASCVAVSGRAVLISGPSGSGKSSVALTLMAFGAALVADDQTEVYLDGDRLMARCPTQITGLIEARGLGLLKTACAGPTEVTLVVDLAAPEPDRLPPRRKVTMLGKPVDLVLGRGNNHLAASVLCYLKGTRQA